MQICVKKVKRKIRKYSYGQKVGIPTFQQRFNFLHFRTIVCGVQNDVPGTQRDLPTAVDERPGVVVVVVTVPSPLRELRPGIARQTGQWKLKRAFKWLLRIACQTVKACLSEFLCFVGNSKMSKLKSSLAEPWTSNGRNKLVEMNLYSGSRLMLSPHIFDHINRLMILTNGFNLLIYSKGNHLNLITITLTVITLSGFHCNSDEKFSLREFILIPTKCLIWPSCSREASNIEYEDLKKFNLESPMT